MKTIKLFKYLICSILLFLVPIGFSLAQPYPNKPVKIIAPFAAGGLADILARTLADKLSKSMNQPFIVENKVGAGGNVGAEWVSRAEPDGYTLLMSSTGIMSINQFLYANMNFDPNGSLTPITMVADMPMLLVVRKSLPVRNLNEFIQLAKNQELFYGSPGNGTTGHLGMEFFTHATGLKLQHVPYKSAAEAVQAALSGQTSTMFDNPPSILAQIQSGELRAIGIASMERIGILPDVPTLNESGLSNFEANSWFGLVGPSKTPKIIIERIQQETSKVLKDPELLKKFNALGARLVGNTPTEFNQIINNDRIRWEKVIKSAGVKIQ